MKTNLAANLTLLKPINLALVLTALLPAGTAIGGAGSVFQFQNVTLPLHHFEQIPENEPQAIADTVNFMNEFFQRTYGQGAHQDQRSGLVLRGPRRGVRPTGHGAVRGTMTVNPLIETRDRAGLFKSPGKQYPVLIRYSNGNPRPNITDHDPDTRGMGLLVMGVGRTLWTPMIRTFFGTI